MNEDHFKVVARGTSSIKNWRATGNNAPFDLAGAVFNDTNLNDADLSNARLEGAQFLACHLNRCNFQSATLRRATLRNCYGDSTDFGGAILVNAELTSLKGAHARFAGADLSNAKLTHSSLTECDFSGANVENAQFQHSNLTAAKGLTAHTLRSCGIDHACLAQFDFSKADLSDYNLTGTSLSSAKLNDTNLTSANLRGAELSDANLTNANLTNADLTGAKLTNSRFENAVLVGAKLTRAHLSGTVLDGADVMGCDFEEAHIEAASFLRVRNVDGARHLETIRINREILYFDSLSFSFVNSWLSWERLRALGKLPLFGPSYAAIILVLFFFYALNFYNEKVDVARAWAEKQIAAGEHGTLADVILTRLSHQPTPSRSAAILIAAICLSIASTFYNLACPPRIKEFSLEQWRYQLQKPALHYVAHSWKVPWLRRIAAAFYLLGGILSIWLLGEKVFEAFRFMVENT